MYRVNFGSGQVSHRFKTRKEAETYIAACKSYGGDPYAASYYVQRYHAGTADDPGDWFRVR